MSKAQDDEEDFSVNLVEERQKHENKHYELNYMTGVIASNEVPRFEKMVFRVTKGNCWIYFDKISHIDSSEIYPPGEKVTYFIFCCVFNRFLLLKVVIF
jgi:hypothetical protein